VIPVLAVAFLLLAGLLLWFVIGSRGAWSLKLPLIVGTCVFTFAVWDALDSFDGWATVHEPPARALFVSAVVHEPDAIYVWLIAPTEPPLLGYRPNEAEPRAFRLPYTRHLHEQVERGSRLSRQGRRVELLGPAGRAGGRSGRRVIRLYRPPPEDLPRKRLRGP
jgi:hypothetical protein